MGEREGSGGGGRAETFSLVRGAKRPRTKGFAFANPPPPSANKKGTESLRSYRL